jgi:hypothetical protein
MSLAVPYCDIVVTDKACHHVLNVARLRERMHTALLRDPFKALLINGSVNVCLTTDAPRSIVKAWKLRWR